MGFGAFAGGFAKTFDAKAVGGAIRDYNATSNYDERMEKANKKYDADMLALNNERAGRQAQNDLDTGKGLPNAIPLQQTSPGGQPVQEGVQQGQSTPPPQALGSGAAPKGEQAAIPPAQPASPPQADKPTAEAQKQAIQPMSDRDYERRSGEIMMAKRQAGLQAQRKYYMDMGQADKAMEVDKQIDKMNWHAGMMNKYYDFMDGKAPDVDKAVLGAVNAMMPRGQKYVPGENGTYNLVDAKGNVLQAGLEFTPQQKMAGFQQAYNIADFLRSGDFAAFMGNSEKLQNMGMAIRKQGETETHNQATEDYQREHLKETARHNRVKEGLDAAANQLRAKRNAIYEQKLFGGAGGKGGTWIGDTKVDEATGGNYQEVRDQKNGTVLGRIDDGTGIFVPKGSSLQAEQGKHGIAAKAGLGIVFDRSSGGNVFVDLKTHQPVSFEEARKRMTGKPAAPAGGSSATQPAIKPASSSAGDRAISGKHKPDDAPSERARRVNASQRGGLTLRGIFNPTGKTQKQIQQDNKKAGEEARKKYGNRTESN